MTSYDKIVKYGSRYITINMYKNNVILSEYFVNNKRTKSLVVTSHSLTKD